MARGFFLTACLLGCAAAREARVYRPLPELLRDAMAVESAEAHKKRLQEIAVLYPDSPVPYFLIARSLEREKKTHDAILYYEKALETRPSCAPCHEALGQVLVQSGQEEKGKRHLLKAKLFDTGGNS